MALPFLTKPPFGGCGDLGSPIDYACLFTGSEWASFTPAEAGDRTKWAFSAWFKRARLGAALEHLLTAGPGGSAYYTAIRFASDALEVTHGASDINWRVTTSRLARDPAAHLHIYVEYDSGQAEPTERVRVWVNGDRLTDFATYTAPVQGYQTEMGAGTPHYIGRYPNASGYHSTSYHSENVLVVGSHPGVEAFGYCNAQRNWVPRAFAGKGLGAAAYGAQGWHLDFADPLDLGKDVSGNGNHFVTTGLTADNQVTDTPTTNYSTLNPLMNLNAGGEEFTRGNLHLRDISNLWANAGVGALPGPFPNKSYVEITVTGTPMLDSDGGVIHPWVQFPNGYLYNINNNGVAALHRFAVDLEKGKVWHAVGDSDWIGGDPTVGSGESAPNSTTSNRDIIRFSAFDGSASLPRNSETEVNGGQMPFAYTPPDGFLPLNAANLPCPPVLRPDDYCTIRLTTGGADVTDLPWDPTQHKTLVVSKRRDTAADWRVVDTVNGAGKAWATNDATGGIVTETDGLTGFTPTGFTVGAATAYQGSRIDYIWRASRRAGFDIVGPIAHTNGTPTTVPHAVGGAVDYAWVVRADAGQDRRVFHKSLSAGQYLALNSLAAAATDAGWFSSTANDLTLGASLPSGTYYVYAWRQVPGFSAFGEYTGNGASDGAFIPTDFAPRALHQKCHNTASTRWPCWDRDRDPENPAGTHLLFEDPMGDGGSDVLDFVSNGLKFRGSSTSYNRSGDSYVFAAWAATPFKFARAR